MNSFNECVNCGLKHWMNACAGPASTPYEGGHFLVDIVLTSQYPFEPPKMRFITKVWHPNVSSANGAICIDILKDQWTPALTLKTALLSLQSLLASPEPSDPQDGTMRMCSHSVYEHTCLNSCAYAYMNTTPRARFAASVHSCR